MRGGVGVGMRARAHIRTRAHTHARETAPHIVALSLRCRSAARQHSATHMSQIHQANPMGPAVC